MTVKSWIAYLICSKNRLHTFILIDNFSIFRTKVYSLLGNKHLTISPVYPEGSISIVSFDIGILFLIYFMPNSFDLYAL